MRKCEFLGLININQALLYVPLNEGHSRLGTFIDKSWKFEK
jgi:hypothetical protein